MTPDGSEGNNQKRTRVVALDLDNTVVDTCERKFKLLGKFVSNAKEDAVRADYELHSFFGREVTEVSRTYFSRLDSDEGIRENPARLVEGARTVIDSLRSRGFEIVILTGRPERTREATIEELARGGIEVAAYELRMLSDADWDFAPNASRVTNFKKRELSDIVKNHSVVALVGDRPEDIAAAEEVGIPGVILATTLSGSRLALIKSTVGVTVCENWREVELVLHQLAAGSEQMASLRADFTAQYASWLGDLDNKCRLTVTLAAATLAISGKLLLDKSEIVSGWSQWFLVFAMVSGLLSMLYATRAYTSRHTSGRLTSKMVASRVGQAFAILVGRPKSWLYRQGDAIDEYEQTKALSPSAQACAHLRFFHERYGTYDPRSLLNMRMLELRATNWAKVYAERWATRMLVFSVSLILAWFVTETAERTARSATSRNRASPQVCDAGDCNAR